MNTHYDVLIVGAGVSGIGMACHLSRNCSDKNVGILERRNAIGGTWDLFRYPGVRSDSDMLTFSYKFKPWTHSQILADGESIRKYVTDIAKEFEVDKKIKFGIKIIKAEWSTQKRIWTITAIDEIDNEAKFFTCNFLISATGYYNYDKGYLPDFKGFSDFEGVCIHPQHWPEKLDYKGKRVIVVGSGATAVTLVPALAKEASHVTMLQRSPSYVYTLPTQDNTVNFLKKFLPHNLAYKISWTRNIQIQRTIYKLSKKFPTQMRQFFLNNVKKQLGDNCDMSHFTPKYMPWDERLCAVPKGDLFKAIKSRNATVVTDHIECFTKQGILLKSGKELEADIIVTATGLNIQMLGGIELTVDGKIINFSDHLSYKGALVQNIPNFAYLFGYTNLSWTVKIDMVAEYICRLLNTMKNKKATVVMPRALDNEKSEEGILDSMSSGYLQRGKSQLPRQGKSDNWCVKNHLETDRKILKRSIIDKELNFLFE